MAFLPSSMRMPSREQIQDALRKVIDPELRKDIVSLGMVRSIEQPDDDRLVIVMTNISPDGEEAKAVEVEYTRRKTGP